MNRACASCCETRKTSACAIESDFKQHEPARPRRQAQRQVIFQPEWRSTIRVLRKPSINTLVTSPTTACLRLN